MTELTSAVRASLGRARDGAGALKGRTTSLDSVSRALAGWALVGIWLFVAYELRLHGWQPQSAIRQWAMLVGAGCTIAALKIAGDSHPLRTPLLLVGIACVPVVIAGVIWWTVILCVVGALYAWMTLHLWLPEVERKLAWLFGDRGTATSIDAGIPSSFSTDPFLPLAAGRIGVDQEAEEIAETKEELLARFDEMVGLDAVKEQVIALMDFVEVQQRRVAAGFKEASTTLHLVFEGNPGTGKTEVARLLGRLLRAVGFLERGQLVEAARQDFVGGYIGSTAIKTDELIDRALNGVLLIDEAYTLAPDGAASSDFGKEAIDTLLKRMEDDRSRLVVVATGYPKPMQRFLDANEGLRSRFTRSITFPDYSTAELVEITDGIARESDYYLAGESSSTIAAIFDDARKSENFGNARYARNLVEAATAAHASRLKGAGLIDATEFELNGLLPADFEIARERLDSLTRDQQNEPNAGDLLRTLGLN